MLPMRFHYEEALLRLLTIVSFIILCSMLRFSSIRIDKVGLLSLDCLIAEIIIVSTFAYLFY